MRMQLFSVAGILALSFVAEKCQQLVREEHSSRSRTERFAFTDCFDMSYGTAACLLKEIIKLYLYYARAIYVQKVRTEAAQTALSENLSKGQDFDSAVAAAREEGNAATRRAKRQVKHVMGPAISAGWDLFETMYVGEVRRRESCAAAAHSSEPTVGDHRRRYNGVARVCCGESIWELDWREDWAHVL